MSIERPGISGPPPATPICPHCHAAMPNVAWNMGTPVEGTPGGTPMAFLTFYCPSCKMVLNCQLLPVAHILSANQVAEVHRALAARIRRPQG